MEECNRRLPPTGACVRRFSWVWFARGGCLGCAVVSRRRVTFELALSMLPRGTRSAGPPHARTLAAAARATTATGLPTSTLASLLLPARQTTAWLCICRGNDARRRNPPLVRRRSSRVGARRGAASLAARRNGPPVMEPPTRVSPLLRPLSPPRVSRRRAPFSRLCRCAAAAAAAPSRANLSASSSTRARRARRSTTSSASSSARRSATTCSWPGSPRCPH